MILARSRYWKLVADEMNDFSYDVAKLLNWEIKCIKQPEDEARFIGVFLYKYGTAYDYTSVHGICYYYNNIDKKVIDQVTKFLHDKFGGKEMKKGDRIFFKDSKEIYTSSDIGELAKELETKFMTRAIISLEFEDLTTDQLKQAGLPESKLLPIPSG